MKSKEKCHSCMGRKVEYHSPPKHPEQGDPYAAMDRMVEQAAGRQPSTLKQARESMKPAQKASSGAAQELQRYLKRLGGGQ
jgi:hypothetical protein